MDRKHHQCHQKKAERYVSVFRVERVPILPPLMTSERRREMQKYKEKAVEIERNLQEQRLTKMEYYGTNIEEEQEEPCIALSNMMRHRSNIPAPVPSTNDRAALRRQYVEASTSTVTELKEKNSQERVNNLSKSETLIYDNKTNSVIMSLDDFNLDIVSTTDSTQVPYICVDPPTPILSQSLFECLNKTEKVVESTIKLPQRSSTSPSLKPKDFGLRSPVSSHSSEPQLIRSNSFTLDSPSSVLLEHIRNQKLTKERCASSIATKHTVESRAKRVKKVETKKSKPSIRRPEVKPKQCSAPLGSTSTYKNKRSPYELKGPAKGKVARKHKTNNIGGSFGNKLKHKTSSSSIISQDPVLQQVLLEDIEERHREKILELMRFQQEEQIQMQQVFEEQQKALINELTVNMRKLRAVEQQSPKDKVQTFESKNRSPTELSQSIPTSQFDPPDSPSSNILTQSLPSSRASSESSATIATKRCTPRRLQFSREASPTAGSCSSVRHQHHEKNQRIAAATKINAQIRGYLTRRLLRTEQVQRIIRTIRDTLIFAINLHLDSQGEEVESKDNVILKARLLQQLNSASRTLHFVFFQTSIQERMEMIARDRKRLKDKSKQMKK